ncbi:hypothetical protein [Azovibrio restrictus]|uniref:hypothetical protein n=1 Tax=Azovibrio restrictus TaxID=146938 RepID=UPI0004073406|nr:hypothetical protein [Azovibrio restrictus]
MGRRPLPAPGLAALLLGVLAGAAQADPCADLPPASVTLERLEVPASSHHRHGLEALQKLGAQASRPGHLVLGLTRGQAVVSYEVKLPRLLDASGRWECASPQLTLRYGYRPITIYVAREFPPGSCAHKEILAHEQRHVEAYQAHARRIEAEIRATLQSRFAGQGPWRGPAHQIPEQLRQELEQRWVPYVKLMLDQVEPIQRAIDTPEEYTRVAASCDGEIARALGKRQR